MTLIMDECVPRSVANVFEARGHEIHHVRELLAEGAPDRVVAWAGDKLGAIIVTWDKHFNALIERVPAGSKAKFKRCGRISFKCSEPTGVELAEKWMDSIEFEFNRSHSMDDRRVIITVMTSGLKIHR